MRIVRDHRELHLCYCSNVHPSEDLDQIRKFLLETTVSLKRRLSPTKHLGLGLYLPASVVDELSSNEYRRWELDAFWKEHGFYVFTLNVFPFGGFHEESVKEKVFEPDWSARERLEHTKKAADLLARWLPEGVRGSLSTHTGAYGHRNPDDPIWKSIAENFARAALHLRRIQEKTGKTLVLSLEPEPFAIVDGTVPFVKFYKEHLLKQGGAWLQKNWSMSLDQAEGLLREHLGVCFDTCHLCVMGESLKDSLHQYRSDGIPIGKAQLSVALEIRNLSANPGGLERLRSFAEPRYFHQTVLEVEEKGGCWSGGFADLPLALSNPDLLRARRLRSHFHVPIFWDGDAEISTTRQDLADALPMLSEATDHLEIETYTWDVIPELERRSLAHDLTTSIENEYRWVLDRLQAKA